MPSTYDDSSTPDPNRAADLPMEQHHLAIEDGALKLNGRIRHCGRNAYRHLRKAWQLRLIDSEMSLFRAITAEEEAGTALILALKNRRYPGASRLDYWRHEQKLAIIPFLSAVQAMLLDSGIKNPNVQLSTGGDIPELSISIDIGAILGYSEPLYGQPDHPLNFVFRMGGSDTTKAYMFDNELRAITDGRAMNDIIEVVRDVANLRNKILYANEDGCPEINFSDELLFDYRRRITILLGLTMAVLQTPSHQLFVVQCLEAFLRALRKLDGDGFTFPSENNGPFVQIEDLPGREPIMRRGYRDNVTVTVSDEWPPMIRVSQR